VNSLLLGGDGLNLNVKKAKKDKAPPKNSVSTTAQKQAAKGKRRFNSGAVDATQASDPAGASKRAKQAVVVRPGTGPRAKKK